MVACGVWRPEPFRTRVRSSADENRRRRRGLSRLRSPLSAPSVLSASRLHACLRAEAAARLRASLRRLVLEATPGAPPHPRQPSVDAPSVAPGVVACPHTHEGLEPPSEAGATRTPSAGWMMPRSPRSSWTSDDARRSPTSSVRWRTQWGGHQRPYQPPGPAPRQHDPQLRHGHDPTSRHVSRSQGRPA